MSDHEELYQIADELRGIATLGLRFGENSFDRERYEHILALSARLIGAVEQKQPEKIQAQFMDNLHHVSPLAGSEGAVFRGGRLLLIKRHDNGLWAIPGGLCEVGETLAQTARRELLEEVCMQGEVEKLLGIFDSRLWKGRAKAQMYHAIFLIHSEDTASTTSEALDVGFFPPDDLPPLSPGHDRRVPVVFKLYQGEMPVPYFDDPEEG